MLADFQILGSSSNGNCGLLRTENLRILIDAGFSGRRLHALLHEAEVDPETIDAVFLTHEHNDHAQGIRGLARRPDLPVFANRETAEAVQDTLQRPVNWRIFQTGTAFRFHDLEVRSFSVPHDACDPVGFTFGWGREGDLFTPPRRLGWVMDLGHIPGHVREHICDVDILVLEANYDETLLENDSRRPWPTKQRIRGRHGHLSNENARELLTGLRDQRHRPREIHLAHLSRDCNNIPLVTDHFSEFSEDNLFSLHVVDPWLGATRRPGDAAGRTPGSAVLRTS